MTKAKNFNDSYIFDLRSHVIAKRGNRSEEIAGQNNSSCQRNVSKLNVFRGGDEENIEILGKQN